MDYHPCRTERGGGFIFYNPWLRQKLDDNKALPRAETTRAAPDDLPSGWFYDGDDVERTPWDALRDYRPHSNVGMSSYQCRYYAGTPFGGDTNSNEIAQPAVVTQENERTPSPGSVNETTAVMRFLMDAAAITDCELSMALAGMRVKSFV